MNEFAAFLNHCILTRSLFLHYRVFAEQSTANDHARVQHTAPIFFGDLVSCLRNSVYLEICKLLDPAKDFRGNANLSIFYMIGTTDLSQNLNAQALQERTDRFLAFRKKLEPARHKFIAHYDRDAVLHGAPLGDAPVADWDQFWSDLDDIIDALSQTIRQEPERLAAIGGMSDAAEALKALRKAEALDRLVNSGNAEALETFLQVQ